MKKFYENCIFLNEGFFNKSKEPSKEEKIKNIIHNINEEYSDIEYHKKNTLWTAKMLKEYRSLKDKGKNLEYSASDCLDTQLYQLGLNVVHIDNEINIYFLSKLPNDMATSVDSIAKQNLNKLHQLCIKEISEVTNECIKLKIKDEWEKELNKCRQTIIQRKKEIDELFSN